MSWLLDTSVLIGSIHDGSPRQESSIKAVNVLLGQSEDLLVVPQNLVEFWAVATRPDMANGLGLSSEQTENEIFQIKLQFVLKPEDETIFENWESLVTTYRVSGKTTHDARIVAAMQTHKIENLLTFNVSDFKRYSKIINVVAPEDVI
ncbi:hypothetical protein BH20ACI2_BH20ACI2_23220 [soil metagenome]